MRTFNSHGNLGNPGASRRAGGFSLIEVMLAVVVLSVGLLALAALQASLTRGAASAKAQSQAIALAEDKIESLRSFTNPTGYTTAIVGGTDTVTPTGGNTYTRATTVTRYCASSSSAAYDNTCTVAATGESFSDFKRVTVAVTWAGPTGNEYVQVSDVIGNVQPSDSGRALTDPSITRPNPQVRIFTPSETGIIPIAYGDNDSQASASSNPKPVQETTGSGATITRFNVQTYLTESGFNPLLQRRQEFAVISCQCETQNTAATNLSSETNIAYEPSYWDGQGYTEPRVIYGKRTARARDLINNNQDVDQFDLLCDRCCRDHHDAPATATNDDLVVVGQSVDMRTTAESNSANPPPYLFDPWRPSIDYNNGIGEDLDHKHYNRTDTPLVIFQNSAGTKLPTFSLVNTTSSGNTYLDTCRFTRVNGVNYVTVDTRLENMTTIRTTPIRSTADSTNVLLNSTDVTNYQAFARNYILKAVGNPTTAGDNSIALPTGYPRNDADSQRLNDGLLVNQLYTSDHATLSTLANTYNSSSDASGTVTTNLLNLQNSRKLSISTLNNYYDVHMRGVYIDFISREAIDAVACIGQFADPACTTFSSKVLLDLLPFYAINLTNLAYWSKPANGSIACDDQAYNNSCSANSLTLYSMSNGFPQTYGATYTRANTQAKANGVANVQGYSYRGNASLTDQYATDYSDANQFPNATVGSFYEEAFTDNEVFSSGTGDGSVVPASTTFKVNLVCYKRANNGTYSVCANNTYWGSQIASIVLTYKTNAVPSAGENPNPTTPPPTVCSASNGSDTSERTCDFGNTTAVGSISFAVKSYNRCTQATSGGNGNNPLVYENECTTNGNSAVANYKLCGVNRSVAPPAAFGYTSSGAASASPYKYNYGATFTNDVSKEVSWLTLTQDSGTTMETTLSTYAKTVANGGSNGNLQLIFLDETATNNTTYENGDACPTVLSTL